MSTENTKQENQTAMELHSVSHLIRKRTTVYANSYTNEVIPEALIEEIVTNGLWAPTHKMTQPWRFVILEGAHKTALGDYMLDYYKKNLLKEQFPESRYEETLSYPKNATLITIILQRSKRMQIPEWEELAAIAAAVQNMWLSCSEMGIGAYWDTGAGTIGYCEKVLELKPNEKSLGIFYMGIPNDTTIHKQRTRKSLHKKLVWNSK